MPVAQRLSRKEIKEDPFVTAFLNAWEYAREHQGTLFAALIILVVVVAAVFWMQASRRGAHIEAVTQFSEALTAFRMGDVKTAEQLFRMVGENHGSTVEGAQAPYFTGQCMLMQGNFTSAIESFDQYLGKSNKNSEFYDAALDGKGVALMNQQKYAEAAEVYRSLVDGIGSNTFMEGVYLRRAADSYALSNQPEKAVDMLKRLLDTSTGIDRRNTEVEIAILGG
jgi:TolA-binding protein